MGVRTKLVEMSEERMNEELENIERIVSELG